MMENLVHFWFAILVILGVITVLGVMEKISEWLGWFEDDNE